MVIRHRGGHIPVDYLRQRGDRVKLTNYLRTGNFKKISGAPQLALSTERRRLVLYLLSFLFFAVGMFFVMF